MINLDDVDAITKIQGGDATIITVDSLPKQLEVSWNETQKIAIPDHYKDISSVLVCGMGGSRFPALIIKEVFKDHLKVPIEIQDEYRVPAWVGKNTLVVLSSYSGTTEEVLLSGKNLVDSSNKIIVITSGGELADQARHHDHPAYIFDPIHNPSGQPRMGGGYLMGGLLGFLFSLRLIDASHAEVNAAIDKLPALTQNWKIDVAQKDNKAKQFAQKLYGRYPYYIVSEHLRGVGNAIANQTNETAKSISDFRIIPELNHHLMEGLKFPKELQKLAITVFFHSSLYSDPIKKRFKITKDVVEQNKIETLLHELKGETKLAQALELLSFGSYLTMYLSTLYEQDPNVIPYVDYFKAEMKK